MSVDVDDRGEHARFGDLICDATATWCNPKAGASVNFAVGSVSGAMMVEVKKWVKSLTSAFLKQKRFEREA
jgi:hypothetical protein